jgi:hypothetical protein
VSDAIERLKLVKSRADSDEIDRQNYSAYVADRIENGWSVDDVAEYRTEVKRIMATGTEDEKLAAREFWASKVLPKPEEGINARIRASIAEDKREAA